MKIQVLLSTMNVVDIEELKKRMGVTSSIQVINQVTKPELPIVQTKDMYSYRGKGLSKSRNLALQKASGDVVVIADDDIQYNNEYVEIIQSAYETYPEVDGIAFYVESLNPYRKVRKQRKHKVNRISAMRIQSTQITFKREALQKNHIEFDEQFGANARYCMGEENILLYDCLKKKMNIKYVPVQIGVVAQKKSTWFRKFNKKYFWSEGAVFYRISKSAYKFLIAQFAIRKYAQYKGNMKMAEAIKYMLLGAEDYKKLAERKEI